MMVNLKEQIQKRTIDAMKAKDSATLGVLRNIKAKITESERTGTDATDEVVQKIVEKYVKQRNESIEIAKKADRSDLVEKEQFEIDLLSGYLPQKLNEDETRAKVQEIIDNGADNIGRVMGGLKSLGNGVDMGLASKIAKELLG